MGGKASDASFTIWMANLVVAYVVDFQSDLLSLVSIALGLTVCFEGSKRLLCLLLKTDRIRSETVRLFNCAEERLGESPEMKLFAYRQIPVLARSRFASTGGDAISGC